MKDRIALVPVAVAALVLSVAVSAAAQDFSKGEVAVAYTFERAQLSSATTTWNLPAGFAADIAFKTSSTVSIVGEFGMNSMRVVGAVRSHG
jgi:hypothetical protein